MLELAQNVTDPLLLVSGDPNFTTPEHIITGAAELALAGATGYGPGEGFLPLREEITKKLATINGVSAEPDQICVTTGACGGLFTSLMLLVEPGDDVLIPDPGWSNYAAMVHVVGGRSVPYPVGDTTNWRLDPAAVEAALTPTTSVLILNSPGNPTGVVFDPDDITAVTELAARRGIMVISDEAYDQLVFDSEPFSVASRMRSDNVLTVYTFSKTYAMTGWRIGYVVGDRDFIRQLSLHQEPVVTSASTISQHAALVALRGPQDFVEDMVRAYRERLAVASEILSNSDISFIEPGGSFFVFADIRATGLGSWDFSTQLLEGSGVAVVPGAAFGDGGEGFVRLTLAAAPEAVERGTRSLAAFVNDCRIARRT